MKEILKLHAANILNNPSVDEKIKSGLIIGDYISLIENGTYLEDRFSSLRKKYESYESQIKNLVATIPTHPARSSDWTLDERKGEKMQETTSRREWVYNMLDACFIDVEINAMEASSVLFLMGSELGLEFYQDFGSHIYDEAKHAQMIEELIHQFPELNRSKTYSNRVWKKISLGENILERLMIENVLEEGLAADKTVNLIEELRKDGFEDVARAFEQINDDEIRHARIGNKWALKLLGDDEELYFETFERLAKQVNPETLKIGSIQTRLASGFSKKFIKKFF